MPRPTTALIVDDESHARTYVRLLLKELGVTMFWEAADAAHALAMFTQHKPGLVVLDMNLRMMTGLQVLQQLKRIQPGLPVIMLTSESALQTVQEALRLGALAYILKHTPKNEALAVLRKAIDSLADPGESTGGAGSPGGN